MRGVLGLILACSAAAYAEDSPTRAAQRAQLETARAQVADQLQLQAYDLIDELVYGWTQQPVFADNTPVVLAEVSVPVGFGSGLQALIENHFSGLVVKYPATRVVLTHCPQCTSMVIRSGAKGTIVSRGVDQPEVLAASGALGSARHALFLDFEIEGAALVLRARLTSLEPALPIVYAKTLSTSTSTPALLRHGDQLKSATAARQEYLDTLAGRDAFLIPIRMGVRSYASNGNQNSQLLSVPFIWLQAGAEVSFSQARAWTGSISAGVSWMPELHTSWLIQGRISRLLTGSVSSLTHPDLYGFVGGSIISVHGLAALGFAEQVPTIENALANLTNGIPHSTFGAFQLGLELRVKNRLGIAGYLETAPALSSAQAVGNYLDLGFMAFQSFGVEATFCF